MARSNAGCLHHSPRGWGGGDLSGVSQTLGPPDPWAAQQDHAPSCRKGPHVPGALGLRGARHSFMAAQGSEPVDASSRLVSGAGPRGHLRPLPRGSKGTAQTQTCFSTGRRGFSVQLSSWNRMRETEAVEGGPLPGVLGGAVAGQGKPGAPCCLVLRVPVCALGLNTGLAASRSGSLPCLRVACPGPFVCSCGAAASLWYRRPCVCHTPQGTVDVPVCDLMLVLSCWLQREVDVGGQQPGGQSSITGGLWGLSGWGVLPAGPQRLFESAVASGQGHFIVSGLVITCDRAQALSLCSLGRP